MVKPYKCASGRKVRGHARKSKRKGPVLSRESIQKILKNPKTPKQLKPYWQKRLATAKSRKK